MLIKKKTDIRDLTKDDIRRLKIDNLTLKTIQDHYLGIPDLYGIINKWNGSDICGGGLDECLEEVMILADAMKLRLNIIHKWTY